MTSSTFDIDSFLEYLLGLSSQLHRHYNTDDLNLAENLLFRAEDCISVLRVILGRVLENDHTPQEVIRDIEYVIGEFQRLCPIMGNGPFGHNLILATSLLTNIFLVKEQDILDGHHTIFVKKI